MPDLEERLKRLDVQLDAVRRRIKGVEETRTASEVFDRTTLLSLYDLIKVGALDLLHGVIKTGKEANVFRGVSREGETVAVKIHRLSTGDYQKMLKYLDGDPRFRGIKKSRRSVVFTWVRKEFKNLQRAERAGVRVPSPIAYKNNILVMEFIGEGDVSAPLLKFASLEDPEETFLSLLRSVRTLYCQGGLVHADLSEYNVLMDRGVPVLIDLSQAVVKEHPRAREFLERDLENLLAFFSDHRENLPWDPLEFVTGEVK
jgi:RIO kinase 1